RWGRGFGGEWPCAATVTRSPRRRLIQESRGTAASCRADRPYSQAGTGAAARPETPSSAAAWNSSEACESGGGESLAHSLIVSYCQCPPLLSLLTAIGL